MQIYKIELIKTKNGNTSCSHKNYLSSRVRNRWFFKPYNYYPYPIAYLIFNISGQNTDKSQQLFENFSTSYILLQRATMVGDYVEHVPQSPFRYTPSSFLASVPKLHQDPSLQAGASSFTFATRKKPFGLFPASNRQPTLTRLLFNGKRNKTQP